jgi:hypothetical protein
MINLVLMLFIITIIQGNEINAFGSGRDINLERKDTVFGFAAKRDYLSFRSCRRFFLTFNFSKADTIINKSVFYKVLFGDCVYGFYKITDKDFYYAPISIAVPPSDDSIYSHNSGYRLAREPYVLFNFINPASKMTVNSFGPYSLNEFILIEKVTIEDEVILIYETPTIDYFDEGHGVYDSGVNFSKIYVSNKRGIFKIEMKPVENKVTKRKYILNPSYLKCSMYKVIIGGCFICP